MRPALVSPAQGLDAIVPVLAIAILTQMISASAMGGGNGVAQM